MANSMNRRDWLRVSALLTGSFSLTGAITSMAATSETASPTTSFVSDRSIEESIAREWPNLKARLFANENPFGPSAKAKQAITDALGLSYQYPMGAVDKLTKMIADEEGVKPEQIMLGAGSSPLLMGSGIYFGKDGGTIISGDPSYDDLPRKAEGVKAKWKKVPLTADYKLDLDAMEKAIDSTTTLMYLCNPNNPTGTIVETAKLKAFCERVSAKVPVFIDEAYIDYLSDPKGSSLMDCVKKGQNVIVARTFSKLHGFAGLRVGYIVSQEDTIKKLRPYTAGAGCISATSLAGAAASYVDKEYLADALKKTVESKEYLYKVLKAEGYEYVPSYTNFVIFPLRMDSERFTEEMMKRGVGVRSWKFASKEWCRVSIGKMDEMKFFEEAFKQLS